MFRFSPHVAKLLALPFLPTRIPITGINSNKQAEEGGNNPKTCYRTNIFQASVLQSHVETWNCPLSLLAGAEC